MPFGRLHAWMTNILAVLGALTLMSAPASMPTSARVIVISAFAVALAVSSTPRLSMLLARWPTGRIKLVGGALLLALAPLGALGDAPLVVFVELVVLVQALLLATRREAREDGPVLVVFLLHVVASTVIGTSSFLWALCLVGVLIVAPGALVLSLLRREVEQNYRSGARDRTGHPVDVARILRSRRVVGRSFVASSMSIGGALVVLTAAFFALCPHYAISLLAIDPSMLGHHARFGPLDFNARPAENDDSVVVRFEVEGLAKPPPTIGLRLRATAFDEWDGKTWRARDTRPSAGTPLLGTPRDASTRYPLVRERDLRPSDRSIRFDRREETEAASGMETGPFTPQPLLVPDRAVAIDVIGDGDQRGAASLTRHAEGDLHWSTTDRDVRYRVWIASEGALTPERIPTSERARYLTLPSDLSPRVRELAHAWTDGARSPLDKAHAIQAHLAGLEYDLDPASRESPDPLDDFLFEGRRGHCLYFATAMAVMLREVGVPTRIVRGFAGGTYNRFGDYYAVRGRDAHAWVEADVDGLGFRSFDPTPAARDPTRALAGALADTRDIGDAIERRWTRDVLRFDGRSAFVSRGIARLAHSPSALGIVGALVTAGLIAWTVRRFAMRRGPASGPEEMRLVSDKAAESATRLYLELERALERQGLPRPRGVPPERFSTILLEQGHALASEVASLTRIYLEARFGGQPLTGAITRDFLHRVHVIEASSAAAPARSG